MSYENVLAEIVQALQTLPDFPRGQCEPSSIIVEELLGLPRVGGFYTPPPQGVRQPHVWNEDPFRYRVVDLTLGQWTGEQQLIYAAVPALVQDRERTEETLRTGLDARGQELLAMLRDTPAVRNYKEDATTPYLGLRALRSAMEQDTETFPGFPYSYCGISAQFVSELFGIPIVKGFYGESHNDGHHWNGKDDVDVDITGDQFHVSARKVHIQKKSPHHHRTSPEDYSLDPFFYFEEERRFLDKMMKHLQS